MAPRRRARIRARFPKFDAVFGQTAHARLVVPTVRPPFAHDFARHCAAGLAALPTLALPAFAAAAEDTAVTVGSLYSHEIMLTALLTGVLTVAVASAVGMMRVRTRQEREIDRLKAENRDIRALADRAEGLLDAGDQLVVVWSGPEEPPVIVGSLDPAAGAPKARGSFLAFGSWLSRESAADLDHRIAALRERGTPFAIELATTSHTYIEAIGRIGGGRPFVRFRDLSAERIAFADLKERHQHLVGEVQTIRAMLDAAPMPVWLRDASGKITWVNPAYAQAVEASDPDAAAVRGLELLDRAATDAVARLRVQAPTVHARLPLVAAGQRRVFDVVDVAGRDGSAGIATDISDLERIQAELRRTIDFHARTLDQLATAVAIFGADKRLEFYNAAYRGLWNLDTAFLDGRPEDSRILDQLRAARKLPEQADFRLWKKEMLAAYQSLEAREHWWHLPDGQTLRVIANPHPQGGVTYVYENVTERLELEKRHNALVRVQGETLDHLNEAVAVFGSDGRLRLWNPPFVQFWALDENRLAARPHISEVIGDCSRLHDHAQSWLEVKLAVTGLADNRTRLVGRMDRRDGLTLEYAAVPLPDGATMVTFTNVTDSVNVERALMEKNEALEEADRIKTDFVGLVSYELRSPLTNIIGFAHLLADNKTGPLNDKQRDYAGHIMTSSQALMIIVDDILDLATIDAGIMKLDLVETDVAAAVSGAVEGVRDRLDAAAIRLATRIAPDVGSFVADQKRVRQILFNLLSNAIRFSPEGGEVRVSAVRDGDDLVLSVEDDGIGIPADQLRTVFDRFHARRQGPNRGGAGLGLSIVKSFVELHGGSIAIHSAEGHGTAVTCRFPGARHLDDPVVTHTAAE
ncbi:ATP-binding protein [Prosthecomicrobium hirschii]|uniref:sensor histidine kinase n=1 Tax=Prosthecodimorpha hirschii TaxID=665126 RepID=UPI0009F94ECC|nr:ATP-binding protein [Prosthecomicrobium hirschii]